MAAMELVAVRPVVGLALSAASPVNRRSARKNVARVLPASLQQQISGLDRTFLTGGSALVLHSRQVQRNGSEFQSQGRAARKVPVVTAVSNPFADRAPGDVRVLVVGPTGYIGKYVTKELIKRGYQVTAFSREKGGVGGSLAKDDIKNEFQGAKVVFGDVTNLESVQNSLEEPVDVVVSCLASRTGGKKDSWLIDYQATKNALDAGKAAGAKHFVLLSAICVQKPLLEFQRAKLKFEAELEADGDLTYSIVRPTAFFKSLAGQVESVKGGGPYVMFGDGQLASCKPISEADLASYIADAVQSNELVNKLLPIGGPGKALSALEQGTMLFEILGKEPKFIKVPIGIMDGAISFLDWLNKFFPGLEDAAEFAKIGRYYAAESMLVYDPATGKYDADSTPSYGKDTLYDFFKNAAENGLAGQELGDAAVWGQK